MQVFSRRSFIGGAGSLAGLAVVPRILAQQDTRPIKVGATLSLTGPLAQSSVLHKIAGEIYIDQINAAGGWLGRRVQWVLLDDQSRPDVTRTLYEKLITDERVDLLVGPYGTGNILSAMTVAERYGKLIVHDTLGIPELAKYARQFPAYALGFTPEVTGPNNLLDTYATAGVKLQSIAIATSKFPSAQFVARGMSKVAAERGIAQKLYLEYEFGARDFGAIATRIRAADADLLWVGALGLEGSNLLEALTKIGYRPRNHFYLYPTSGPLAQLDEAQGATSVTLFEDVQPLNTGPIAKPFAEEFRRRAQAANIVYALPDTHAAEAYAQWQVLGAAVMAAGDLNDAALSAWLKVNAVNTVIGKISFEGQNNYGPPLERVRQLQNKRWEIVWPQHEASQKFIPPSV